jgi:HlyD family secretion protein
MNQGELWLNASSKMWHSRPRLCHTRKIGYSLEPKLHQGIYLPVLLLIAACLSTAAICGCSDRAASAPGDSKGAAGAVRVQTSHPQRKTMRRVVDLPAQIVPYEETPLFAKVAGYVRTMNVDIGDRIRGPKKDASGKELSSGQILAELFIPEIEDEVRQKEALIAQAEANVKQARAAIDLAEAAVVTSRATVAEAESAIKRTESEYQKRDSELRRIVELAQKSAVTEKLVDETRNHLEAADADRQETRAKIEAAKAAVVESEASLEKAKADLTAAEARVRVATADHAHASSILAYGTLRAPYDGIVTRRNVHTGRLVQPGSPTEPLLVLMRTDILRIIADVPEGDAAMVKPGNQVSIRIPAMPGETVTGQITRTAGALDTSTRTLRAEIDVPNSDDRLRPGMYAYVKIVEVEHPNVLVVPASAVLTEKNRTFCSCVAEGKIVRKDVIVGLRDKDEMEIASGLQGDEWVVAVNSLAYVDGEEVDVKP